VIVDEFSSDDEEDTLPDLTELDLVIPPPPSSELFLLN